MNVFYDCPTCSDGTVAVECGPNGENPSATLEGCHPARCQTAYANGEHDDAFADALAKLVRVDPETAGTQFPCYADRDVSP